MLTKTPKYKSVSGRYFNNGTTQSSPEAMNTLEELAEVIDMSARVTNMRQSAVDAHNAGVERVVA